jgi:hypothetical protein
MAKDNLLSKSFAGQSQTVETQSEQAPLLGSLSDQASSLGSLSQAARHKQLNTARGILIGVGIMTFLVNLAFFATIESQVNDLIKNQVDQLHKRGLQEDPASLAAYRSKVIKITQLFQGGAVALGVVFVILGCLVKRHPVSSTIMGMVLYLGSNALFGYFDPETLAKGLLIKIIVVFVLAKSIHAAIAYQREQTTRTIETPPVPI